MLERDWITLFIKQVFPRLTSPVKPGRHTFFSSTSSALSLPAGGVWVMGCTMQVGLGCGQTKRQVISNRLETSNGPLDYHMWHEHDDTFLIVCYSTVATVGSCLRDICSWTERGATASRPESSEARGGLAFSSPTRGSSLAGSACWLLPGWLFSSVEGLEGTATLAPPTAP